MKCANCDSLALYVYQTPSVGPIPYCNGCLPSFLRPQAKAGLLDKTEAHTDAYADALDVLTMPPKPKRAKRAVPAAIVETDPEPVVEESEEV